MGCIARNSNKTGLTEAEVPKVPYVPRMASMRTKAVGTGQISIICSFKP